jgi:hypothetical protein
LALAAQKEVDKKTQKLQLTYQVNFAQALSKRGVAIFAKACFGHPSPSKRQKLNATAKMVIGITLKILP